MPREDGVNLHLLEYRALVFDLLARYLPHMRNRPFDAFAPVRFHHADDDVFAAATPAQGLAQHAEGLAHAWRVTEEELEDAARFLRRRSNLQPFFWLFGQGLCSPRRIFSMRQNVAMQGFLAGRII